MSIFCNVDDWVWRRRAHTEYCIYKHLENISLTHARPQQTGLQSIRFNEMIENAVHL